MGRRAIGTCVLLLVLAATHVDARNSGSTGAGTTRRDADALARRIDAELADFRVDTDAVAVEALARRELALRGQLDGEASLAYVHALSRLGFALAARNANDAAAAQFERAWKVVAALGDRAGAGERARADIDLGFARRNQRTHFAEAVDLIRKGLARNGALPPLERARAQSWLVMPLLYSGKPGDAAQALDAATASLARAGLPGHPLHAELLRLHVPLLHEQGRFAEAMQFGERAVAAAAGARPYSPAIHIAALHTRAQLEEAGHDTQRARRLFERELAVEAKYPVLGGFSAAMAHYELCNTLAPAGQVDAAEPHCRAAAAALEALPSPPAFELASAYATLAYVLGDLGRVRDEGRAARRSLVYAERTGLNTPWVFGAEVALGTALKSQRRYVEAEAMYRRHLARFPPHADFSSQNPAATWNGLAGALWGEGKLDAAFAAAETAEHSAALVRAAAATDLDEHRALNGIGGIRGGIERMLAIASITRKPAQLRAAWQAALESNGLISTIAARRLAAVRASHDPALAPLWQDWQARNKALAQARVALARSPGESAYAAFVAATDAFDASELKLAAATGDSGRRLALQHHGIDEVRAALPADTVLASFVETAADRAQGYGQHDHAPTLLRVFLAQRNRRIQLLSLGDAAVVASAAAQWYRLVSNPRADAAQLSAASRALRRLVWDPLAAVASGSRILLVPSASIERVNFAALERDDGRFLVESGPRFQFLNRERDLLLPPAQAPGSLLLAGAPDFATGTGAATRGDCRGLRGAPFRPLPGARSELDELARLASGQHLTSVLLAGAAATEAGVRKAAPAAGILHFATHGVYLGQHCDRADAAAGSRSMTTVDTAVSASATPLAPLAALVFSGANRGGADSADDGLLTSDEIEALDLSRVDWAVLSACETALGATTAHEGVLGLQHAFQLAGVRSVIMSLWRVDDRATEQFMQALYRARLQRHASTIDALNAAMRDTLAARRHAGLSTRPFYWGGFIAAGDWR